MVSSQWNLPLRIGTLTFRVFALILNVFSKEKPFSTLVISNNWVACSIDYFLNLSDKFFLGRELIRFSGSSSVTSLLLDRETTNNDNKFLQVNQCKRLHSSEERFLQ